MNDDTVEFSLIGLTELFSVGTDSIEANDDVATDAPGIGVVEGDDVSVVIVAEELAVNAEDMLIINEEVGDGAYGKVMGRSHRLYPTNEEGGRGR